MDSVKQRLIMGAVLIVLSLLLSGANHYISLRSVDDSNQHLRRIGEAQLLVQSISQDITKLQYTDFLVEDKAANVRMSQLVVLLREVQNRTRVLKGKKLGIEVAELVSSIDSLIDFHISQFTKSQMQQDVGVSFSSQIRQKLDVLGQRLAESRSDVDAELSEQIDYFQNLGIAISLIAIFSAILMVIWVVVTLGEKLQEMTEFIQALSKGHTDFELPDIRQDHELYVMFESACNLKRQIETNNEVLKQSHRLAIERTQASIKLKEEMAEREKAEREAELASKAKSLFLANMSHELRTPMNAIVGFNERLIKRLEGVIEERDMDALKTVQQSSEQLLALIKDLLDLSKIEAGTMDIHRERVNLISLIEEIKHTILPLADEKGLSFIIEPWSEQFYFFVDPNRMKQIILNLLSNGIKYTEKGSVTLRVSRGYIESMGEAIKISVKDTGIGLKAADQEALFQGIGSLHTNYKDKIEGIGLGLDITAEFVRMHDGLISVDSEYGVGSEFSVTIPVGDITNVIENPADIFPRFVSKARKIVLLIDGNEMTVDYMSFLLEGEGYEVSVASNYVCGIYRVQQHKPDLILIDPSTTGAINVEWLESLKDLDSNGNGENRSPGVIVYADSENDQYSKYLGDDSFLSKFSTEEAILNKVGGVLNQ